MGRVALDVHRGQREIVVYSRAEAELMEEEDLITRDPDILGGVPVFVGTRVPVKTLVEYLEKGHSFEVFLDDFPTVTRRQAQEVTKGDRTPESRGFLR